jgi:hypothetical protein
VTAALGRFLVPLLLLTIRLTPAVRRPLDYLIVFVFLLGELACLLNLVSDLSGQSTAGYGDANDTIVDTLPHIRLLLKRPLIFMEGR